MYNTHGALSCKAKLLLLSDAADVGIILADYAGYEMPGNVWTWNLLFGKGLCAAGHLIIPQKELHIVSFSQSQSYP